MDHSTHLYCYAISIALSLVVLRTVVHVLQAPTSKCSGPWYTKWTSLVCDFYFLTGRRTFYVHALHQRFGPVVRIGPNEVDITDLEAVKTIYSTKETFRKSDFYTRVVTQGQQSMFSTTDVIGKLTFGDSFRMLELGHKNEYVRELERVGRMGALRAVFPSLVRFSGIVPLPVFKRVQGASKNLRTYASQSLARYRKLVEANPDLQQHTLFSRLFAAEKDDTMPFNEMRDEAVSYIVAGSDTTSNTLTYLTWSVCRSPRLRAALVDELQKLPADFAEAQLRDLPLLNHVIDETLRLYSAAPSGLPRVVPPGGAELAGYWFDEGTVVCAQAYSMHRDSAIFSDPQDFRPSRWEEPTKAMKEAYMPFGCDPRVYIGQHLARAELRLATARFFLAFPKAQISSLGGMSDLDMKPKIHFLLSPSGGRCLVQAR